MARLPSVLMQHTVQIERLAGTGPYGEVYDPPATLSCFRDDKRRLVRSTSGSEVVSETTLYAQPDTPTIPAGSRVDLGDRHSTVIVAHPRDGGRLPVPSHVEVICE